MKKQLIMAAMGVAMAFGVAGNSASAAPISAAGITVTDQSTSLAEKTHYRRHYHRHNHRHYGWRKWRPRMFGYSRHRHYNRHYHSRRHNHHHYR